MKKPKVIVTHPGSAHKDDFLACCLLIYRYHLPVVRREPLEQDLSDPTVIVVDAGGEHEPSRMNFDHHQFPRDHEPICALSLVLKELGIYEDAKAFCEWLEPAEWFDTRGPFETAKWMGVPREVMAKLNSPIDITLLRRFAQKRHLRQRDPIWEVMRMIGEDLVMYLRTLREKLDYVARNAQFLQVGEGAQRTGLVFMPRTDPLPDDPSSGMGRYIEMSGKKDEVAALIYPDRRGPGYGLARFQDNENLDFSRIEAEEDVHFAHARGFVAKTSAVDQTRLFELVLLARIS